MFDLDGTLLNINMDYFLKKYFEKMLEMAEDYGFTNKETLAEKVYKSTLAMITNKDANLRNEEVFLKDFLNRWPYSEEKIINFFNQFYEKGFPLLKQYCKPIPGIPEMMQDVFNKGYKVVIATNAVFPMTALKNRLDWAGLGKFDFELITSYEIMHFCKPHIEYYKEISDKIRISPKECIMVGNDRGEDLPAGEIGMTTFLVEDMLIDKGNVNYEPDYRGFIPDLFKFIKQLDYVK